MGDTSLPPLHVFAVFSAKPRIIRLIPRIILLTPGFLLNAGRAYTVHVLLHALFFFFEAKATEDKLSKLDKPDG